jgi:drug/metabolite transporter (DMT)-like permease
MIGRAFRTARGPLLRLTAGAVLISFAPVLVNIARVGPTPAGFYRLLFGGLVLGAVVIARRGRWSAGRRHLIMSAVAGAFLALDLAVWHRSILLIGPGLATILANFQVFFLAGFGILLLGERMTWRLGVAVPIAMVGLFLVFGIDWNALDAAYRVGVGFGLLTALCYASYLLSLRRAQAGAGKADPIATMAILSLIAAGLLAVTVRLEGESFRIPDWSTFWILVAYALVPQVAGWVLIATALPQVDASRAGLTLLLQPTLAFVWDLLLFGRPTTVVQAGGAVLTLGAIYLGLTRSPQQHSPSRSQHA